MFDLTHGLIFVIGSMTLIISILVVVNYIINTSNKEEEELNEAQKSIQKMNDKELMRTSLKNYPEDTDRILLKDYLFNILSNHTQSKSMMKRDEDERIFNNKMKIIRDMLNKKMHKKKVNRIAKSELIEFRNFNENSLDKNLIHCHSILTIPKKFIMRVTEMIVELTKIIISKMKFDISVTHRPTVAINYMTKMFNENNDRSTVF